MTVKAKFLAAYSEFKTYAAATGVQYGIPNMGFEPATGSAYFFFRFIPGPAVRASLGVNHHRVMAVIHVEIGVPLNSGEAAAFGYADTVAGWFRDKNISGIVCHSPEIVNMGQVGDWHKMVVSVPVYWDETF